MSKNKRTKRTKRIDAWVRRHIGKHFCHCGCNSEINISRKHYSSGVPLFIKGHNMNGSFNPQTDNLKPTEETYWEKLPDEDKKRRLSQLKSFPRGEGHPNWAGGKYITDSGYVHILVNDHPYAVGNYIAEHRFVVEKWMRENFPEHPFMEVVDGFPVLKRDKVIHHRNKLKTCNVIENLIVMDSQATHVRWHAILDKSVEKNDYFLMDKFEKNIFCPWIKRDCDV